MHKRHFKFIAFAFLLVVTIAVYKSSQREPSYGGRTLSSWLQDMDGYAGPKMSRAQEAVRAIGTNAVPGLVSVLRLKDSDLKQRLAENLNKLLPGKAALTPLMERHRQVIYACEALGPGGRAAIPELSALLYERKYETLAHPIAYTLAGMGPDAVPYLTNALTSTNAWVRS